VGRGIAQALGEIATGEAGRRSFHLPQRSEGAGDEQAREKSAENNGDEAGGYKDRGEVLNCLTGLFQINSNNQGGGAFRHRGLTHDVQRVDVKAPIGVAIDARGSGGVIVVENPPRGEEGHVGLVAAFIRCDVACQQFSIRGHGPQKVVASRPRARGGVKVREVLHAEALGESQRDSVNLSVKLSHEVTLETHDGSDADA